MPRISAWTDENKTMKKKKKNKDTTFLLFFKIYLLIWETAHAHKWERQRERERERASQADSALNAELVVRFDPGTWRSRAKTKSWTLNQLCPSGASGYYYFLKGTVHLKLVVFSGTSSSANFKAVVSFWKVVPTPELPSLILTDVDYLGNGCCPACVISVFFCVFLQQSVFPTHPTSLRPCSWQWWFWERGLKVLKVAIM